MNKYLLYTVLFIGLLFASCTDDKAFFDEIGQKVPVSLTVSFTGDVPSRDVGSKDETLDYTTDPQSAMSSDDVYVLVFSQTDDKLMGLVQDLKLEPVYNNYNEKRLLGNIPTDVVGQEIRLVVLANLNQNKINLGTATSVKDFLTNKVGETSQSLYQDLIYPYDNEDAPWEIIKEGKVVRRIPMWGETEEFTLPADGLSLECFLYRAIAKVNIWINGKEGINSFKINSITVNHANKGGYVVSSQKVSDDIAIQYTAPDVPASVESRGDGEKIVYENLTEDQATKAFSDVIFLPEHVNTTGTPVSLTVNYTFNGETLEKNIEFKDKDGKPFDVVRNHSYIFDITKIHNEFIFKVTVEPWENVYMRGAPDQYTLTVDKSVITLKDYVDYKNSNNPNHHYIVYDLDVWTDYSYGWKIETNESGQIIDTDGKVIDWLDIVNTSGNTNETVTVKLNANKINTGLAKTAKFYVKAGNIRKEITVIMPQPETANCYVVGDGEYEIIVTIKGNGAKGTRPENMDIVDGDEKTSPEEDATLKPTTLGIIWETKGGLISLWDYTKNAYVSGSERVPYNQETGTLGFSVKSNYTGAYIAGAQGGNALVGAFDQDGKLIWSWHIWACPEMYDSETHQIKENVFLQDWAYTGYQMMDRNLGALSNKPIETQIDNQRGVAAMGLQYQWGRKDPFIGPAYSNDDFSDNGLLPVVHYYEKWGVNGQGQDVVTVDNTEFSANKAIEYTIKHPTQLVYWNDGNGPTALVSYDKYGGYLWGTNKGLDMNVKDLGTKTIYDPCPVGYRVPPVDAFMFSFDGYKGEVYGPYLDGSTWKHDNYLSRKNYKDIDSDSGDETTAYNVRDNVIYIPHYVNYREDTELYVLGQDGKTQIYIKNAGGRYQWGDYHTWISCYEGAYVVNADYYGFYVNLEEMKEPKLENIKKSSTVANNSEQYDDAREYGNNNKKVEYYYKPSSNQLISWLPMTGAYDPTKGFSFKDSKNNTISIEQGSTITVNSFLWTNSSVNRTTGLTPAALSLHGTEVHNANSSSNVNGRHFHNLSDTYANVDRHYTSGVRCIKDTDKFDWKTANSLTKEISIKNGESGTISIKSVNGTWKLVDPGAPWIQITPEKGEATGAQTTSITVKVSADASVGSTTNIGFLIEGETTPRYCTVTVTK